MTTERFTFDQLHQASMARHATTRSTWELYFHYFPRPVKTPDRIGLSGIATALYMEYRLDGICKPVSQIVGFVKFDPKFEKYRVFLKYHPEHDQPYIEEPALASFFSDTAHQFMLHKAKEIVLSWNNPKS